jgi:hypothetical protein
LRLVVDYIIYAGMLATSESKRGQIYEKRGHFDIKKRTKEDILALKRWHF